MEAAKKPAVKKSVAVASDRRNNMVFQKMRSCLTFQLPWLQLYSALNSCAPKRSSVPPPPPQQADKHWHPPHDQLPHVHVLPLSTAMHANELAHSQCSRIIAWGNISN